MARNTAPVLTHAAAMRAVDAWNAAHPVGTPVVVTLDDGSEVAGVAFRPAMVIGDRMPAIGVQIGKVRAGFVLSRVRAK